MNKIKRIILILAFLIIGIFIIGCSGECKDASDCEKKTCFNVKCIKKECKSTPILECCGNGMEEDTEDGKPGNECTCPADYGECKGKVTYEKRGREYETQYLGYVCKPSGQYEDCVLGVDGDDVKEVTLLDEKQFSYFKLETLVTYNKPLDIFNDKINFRITLVDTADELVLPVKINKIILKQSEILYGELVVNQVLTGVGDIINANIPITYEIDQVEEERSLSFKLDYEYTKQLEGKPEELIRDDYENTFRTQIFLVKTGEDAE